MNISVDNVTELANPLLNLAFIDDSGAHFLGIQQDNVLTITGYTWLEDSSGGPEFSFANLNERMLNEKIEAQSEIVVLKSNTVITHNNIVYPYQYNFEINKNKLFLNLDGLTLVNYQSLSKGVRYPITLSWYGNSATYYVIFDIDPATI